MMCRVYNRLDMSYGDGDGILTLEEVHRVVDGGERGVGRQF